jgi:hypothetical protein
VYQAYRAFQQEHDAWNTISEEAYAGAMRT